jgi:hypothetical protein
VRILLIGLVLVACASAKTTGTADMPSEAARHRAALACLTVSNATPLQLTIAFRTAAPPFQEVVIGRVAAGAETRVAPVPAGEPIVLIARLQDGAELALAPRLFSLDAEWTWEIPKDANFTRREPPR